MLKPAILGGTPVRQHAFPKRRTMGAEEKKAALEVLDSDVLSAFIGATDEFFLGGPKVRAFEDSWAERYGFRHAISVNSATSGLVTAIGAVGIEPGDEVICSPYTMSASATAALFYGGIPVFADIDPDTFCLDPASIEARITPRTKAIIVVHIFGGPAEMDSIMALARKHGIRVIEDAAQSPGVKYRGRSVGVIGDVGCFSLNYHKHIHTGEGGMLTTNDPAIARRCQLIRNHGENAFEEGEELANVIGGNYRLTELQAAIGLAQLDRLEGYLTTRQELAAHFGARLAGMKGLTAAHVPEGCTHAWYVYPVKYDAEVVGLSRSQFVQAVQAELPSPDSFEGTAFAAGYVRPLYWNKIYQQQIAIGRKGFPFNHNPGVRYDYSKGLCPVAERMHEHEMLICPLIREPLTIQDIDDLAEAIEKVLANAGEIHAAAVPENTQEGPAR